MNPQTTVIFEMAGWTIAIWFMIRSIWRYDGNEKRLIELALNSATHWEQCSANYRSIEQHLTHSDTEVKEGKEDIDKLYNMVDNHERRITHFEEVERITQKK